jgi:hypothetical protein
MTSRCFGSLLVFLPLALTAQSLQERSVPLNNWAVPRQVKRSQVLTQHRVLTPKLQLPGGATPDVLVFTPIPPCRLADTRPTQPYPALGTTPLAALTPRTLPIAGACGVEAVGTNTAGPEAYSLNITVVPPSDTTGGYLLAYPNPATPIPLVASMTWNPGASYQSNTVIAASSPNGSVNVVASSQTDVVIDINGYYAAPTNNTDNTGAGSYALGSVSTGSDNTAFGFGAVNLTTGGNANTGIGYLALEENVGGSYNVALGYAALQVASGANDNTAVGATALQNTTGSTNTALGNRAGINITTGGSNIMIENQGEATDDHAIRIGDTQTTAYMAGILGNALASAATVVINSSGQLGVAPPIIIVGLRPRRDLGDVQDMGDTSKGLMQLRPVTFHSKNPNPDGSKPLEYGLIAEEVAEVYPELVAKGKDGQLEAAQFSKLPVMLLNELQKQYRHAEQQDEMIKKLEARLAALEAQLSNATAPVTPDEGNNR